MKHIDKALTDICEYWGRPLTDAAVRLWYEEFKTIHPRDLSEGVRLAQRRERITNFPSLDTILRYVDEVKQARVNREKENERTKSVMPKPTSSGPPVRILAAFTMRMLEFRGSRKERIELNLNFWEGLKAKYPESDLDETIRGYRKDLQEEIEKEGGEAKQNRPPFKQEGTIIERSNGNQYLHKGYEKSLAISQINDPSEWEFNEIPF